MQRVEDLVQLVGADQPAPQQEVPSGALPGDVGVGEGDTAAQRLEVAGDAGAGVVVLVPGVEEDGAFLLALLSLLRRTAERRPQAAVLVEDDPPTPQRGVLAGEGLGQVVVKSAQRGLGDSLPSARISSATASAQSAVLTSGGRRARETTALASRSARACRTWPAEAASRWAPARASAPAVRTRQGRRPSGQA
ncbi:hypothetical protein ACQ4WX_39130 [Streptomyces lasalocidi]